MSGPLFYNCIRGCGISVSGPAMLCDNCRERQPSSIEIGIRDNGGDMKAKGVYQDKDCKRCGDKFTPGGPNTVYCKECSAKRRAERNAERYTKKDPGMKVPSPPKKQKDIKIPDNWPTFSLEKVLCIDYGDRKLYLTVDGDKIGIKYSTARVI